MSEPAIVYAVLLSTDPPIYLFSHERDRAVETAEGWKIDPSQIREFVEKRKPASLDEAVSAYRECCHKFTPLRINRSDYMRGFEDAERHHGIE